MNGSCSPRAGQKRPNDADDPNGKKQKNRDAAKKCRMKKQETQEEYKKKNKSLMKDNENLILKKQELEKILQQCIERIEYHKRCGCQIPMDIDSIINATEIPKNDFIPIGTQTILVANSSQNAMPQKSGSLQDNQSTVTGLFSGNQVASNSAGQIRQRNPSGRSPSVSPAPTLSPALSATGSPMVYTNSMNSSNLAYSAPAYTPSYQHMERDPYSPKSSPAQTVPDIDPDCHTTLKTYQKPNGFPAIDEAVQQAQADPGITDVSPYGNSSNWNLALSNTSNFSQERSSVSSLGFTPTAMGTPSPSSSSSFQPGKQYSVNYKNSSFVKNNSPFKVESETVSMNHTAELFSQALTNFNGSEISEDLKNQMAQVANGQGSRDVNDNLSNNESIDQKLVNGEGGSNVFTHQQQLSMNEPAQPPLSHNSMTFDMIIQCATENDMPVSFCIEGKEYECNVEGLKMLRDHFNSKNLQFENIVTQLHSESNTMPPEAVATFQQSSTMYRNPQIPVQEVIDPTLYQNVACVPQTYLPLQSEIINPYPTTQVVDTTVESSQLPTTVVSMIMKDTDTNSKASPEFLVESGDFSHTLDDLPSLSFADHDSKNIFEKKRKKTGQ